MDLKGLKESISSLSDTQLLDLLLDIRSARRTFKEKAPIKRAARATKMQNDIANLKPEDLQQLLELLK